jgi:DNA repair and recombination protein RAD52
MSKTIGEIRQELDKNIPRDVISQRDGGGPKKLSYLEGWYVIDRLNQVFGQGNWSYQLGDLTKTFEGEVNGKYYVSYIAKVDLSVKFPGQDTSNRPFESNYFTDVGFGDGQDARNPGKAHELAVKEAVTDGIKRCAKSLGRSMGLALYDKTQEYVDESNTTDTKSVVSIGSNPARASAPKENFTPTAPTELKPRDAGTVRQAIRAAARVLDSQKKLTLADFKSRYLTPEGVDKIDQLVDNKVLELYDTLKKEHSELKLA